MNLKEGLAAFIPTLTCKPIVLLVDDDEVLRLILRRMLESDGFDVMETTNGREALTAIHARRSDVVITDIMMPVMDGIALIRHLKEHPDMASIYIIAMSGTADDAIQSAVLEWGISDFFDKSVDIKNIIEMLRLALPSPPSFNHSSEANGETLSHASIVRKRSLAI